MKKLTLLKDVREGYYYIATRPNSEDKIVYCISVMKTFYKHVDNTIYQIRLQDIDFHNAYLNLSANDGDKQVKTKLYRIGKKDIPKYKLSLNIKNTLV